MGQIFKISGVLVVLVLFLGGCFGMEGLSVDFVTGIVTDTTGGLIEGATVSAQPLEKKEDEDAKEIIEVTDSSGMFSVQGFENGRIYKVTASKEGYISQGKTIKFHSNAPSNLSFVLTPGVNAGQQQPYSSGNNMFQQTTASSSPVNPQTARVYVAYALAPQMPGSVPSNSSGPGSSGPRTLNEMSGVLYGADPMAGNLSFGDTHANPLQQLSSNHITLIDFNSHKIVGVVPFTSRPYWILFHPGGRVCYITDETKRIIVISPLQNNAVIASIGVGDALITDFAINSSGSRLYAALRSGLPQIAVIDTSSNQVTRFFPLPQNPQISGAQPGGIAVSRDGSTLLVTMGNTTGGELLILDAESGNLLGRVPVGSMPLGVGITPDGKMAVVANYASASVTVVDVPGRQVAGMVPAGTQPAKVVVRPDGRLAYITNSGSGSISVIDPYSQTPITMIPVGQNPMGVAVTPDGKRIYVANNGSGTITIIDAVNNSIIGTTSPVQGSKPYGIGVRP